MIITACGSEEAKKREGNVSSVKVRSKDQSQQLLNSLLVFHENFFRDQNIRGPRNHMIYQYIMR